MRYAIIIPDGAADMPCAELSGKTPLEAAAMPALAQLAKEGRMLAAQTVPAGFPPGSDVACLSVMGYNPDGCYTGRAPLEAASLGIKVNSTQAVFRANTVTVLDGLMKSYAAGHISTDEARPIIEYLDAHLNIPGVKLYPGIQYRHACVIDNAAGKVPSATPPHDISGKPVAGHEPKDAKPGDGTAAILERIMGRTIELLMECPANQARAKAGKMPVTQLWLWGGGVMPKLDTYADKFGVAGGVISAVDLIRGIAKLAGLEVIIVPGATGYYDTNYKGKGEAALASLAKKEFVVVHMESSDEASHNGDLKEKLRALENIDKHIIAPILAEAKRSNDLRILVMPDHPTPICKRTHTSDAVPACIWGPGIKQEGPGVFSEAAIAGLEPVPGHTLAGILTTKG